jgi:hypothetical protein
MLNIKALEASGRLSNPFCVDCSDPKDIQTVQREGCIPCFDATTKVVYLTKAFYDRLEDLLQLLLDIRQLANPDAASQEAFQGIIEVKHLLHACGMDTTEEKAKLISVKGLLTNTRLAFMSIEDDERIRRMEGDRMIRAGSFKDWDEIAAYGMIQNILSM